MIGRQTLAREGVSERKQECEAGRMGLPMPM